MSRFFDIPFAAMKEKSQADEEWAARFKDMVFSHKSEKDSVDKQKFVMDYHLDGLRKVLERFASADYIDKYTPLEGSCGLWSIKGFLGFPKHYFDISYESNLLVKCGVARFPSFEGLSFEYIAERHSPFLSDKSHLDIVSVVSSVSNNHYSIPKKEQEKIDANRRNASL